MAPYDAEGVVDHRPERMVDHRPELHTYDQPIRAHIVRIVVVIPHDQILNDMADTLDQDFSKMKALAALVTPNGDVRVEFERVTT